MANSRHEKAVDLTEAALEKLADGNDSAADKLIKEANKLDPTASKDVLADIDEDLIQRRAYELWEAAGRPEGQHQEHWDQARREVQAGDS